MRTVTSMHALIVGGTRGAGAAAVRLFSEQGNILSVISRSGPKGGDPGPAGVEYQQVDISDSAEVRTALKGIVEARGLPQCVALFQRFRGTGDPLHGELEVSVRGTRDLIDLLVGEFDLKDCSIVIVSSVNAEFIDAEVTLGYHIGKAALKQLVRYYAVTLGHRGIRVNGVSPGTYLKEESMAYYEAHPEIGALYARITPLGRIGRATEIADVVAYLCSGSASFVTGQTITVDGGLTLRLQDASARNLFLESRK